MQVILSAGEKVTIIFQDTDGEIIVDYDSEGDYSLKVIADFPDSLGREGVIYLEDFSQNCFEGTDLDDPIQSE